MSVSTALARHTVRQLIELGIEDVVLLGFPKRTFIYRLLPSATQRSNQSACSH